MLLEGGHGTSAQFWWTCPTCRLRCNPHGLQSTGRLSRAHKLSFSSSMQRVYEAATLEDSKWQLVKDRTGGNTLHGWCMIALLAMRSWPSKWLLPNNRAASKTGGFQVAIRKRWRSLQLFRRSKLQCLLGFADDCAA